MNTYKADLHIHTLLSPCGDLSMSPAVIVEKAVETGLQIIGIADHNSTRQGPLIRQMAAREGILCLCGCEITSKEEAHCLAFFEDDDSLSKFQTFLDKHLPDVKNDVDRFGYQVAVNEAEEIVFEESRLLISALDVSIDELYEEVHKYNGLFIPAHVDKPSTSLMSQLGFIPPDIRADALELTRFTKPEDFIKRFAYLKKFSFFQSSDAHIDHLIGSTYSFFHMEALTFDEVRRALHREDGRFVSAGS